MAFSNKEQLTTYRSWANMKQRCNNPNYVGYIKHGGRGIKICDRWNDFDNFLCDMGLRPDGCTLDRINNDGNYEPSNCRWATPLEQRHNRRKQHNLVHERKCKLCSANYKPICNTRISKYCSRDCQYKDMLGKPARYKDGIKNLKQFKAK